MVLMRMQQRVPFLLLLALIAVIMLKITQVSFMTRYGIVVFEAVERNPEISRFQLFEDHSGALTPPPGHKMRLDYRGLTPYEVVSVGVLSRIDDTVTWMIMAGLLTAFFVTLSRASASQMYPHTRLGLKDGHPTILTHRLVILYASVCIIVSLAYLFKQQTQLLKSLAGTFFVDSPHLSINIIQVTEGIINLFIIWLIYLPLLVMIPLSDLYCRLFEDGHCETALCRGASLLLNAGILPFVSMTVTYTALLLALRDVELEYGRGFRFALSYSPMKTITWLLLSSGGYSIVALRFIIRFVRSDRRRVKLGFSELPYKLFWPEFRPVRDASRKTDE